jgi:hypothetical protein
MGLSAICGPFQPLPVHLSLRLIGINSCRFKNVWPELKNKVYNINYLPKDVLDGKDQKRAEIHLKLFCNLCH